MATRKKKTEEATVVKGSHLTVTTYPDGRTELEWDDEALMRDVQEAIASVEGKQEKPKRKRKEKA
jgi:hypothetical protein